MPGSSGGGGGGSTEIVPWAPVEPYAKEIIGEAQDQYQNYNPTMYPYSGVAPLNPYQTLSADLTAQRALEGSPLTAAGQDAAGSIASGNYLFGPASQFYTSMFAGPNAGNAATPYAQQDMLAWNPNQAAQYFTPTAQGQFVNPDTNPYLDAYYDRATEQAQRTFQESLSPGLDAQYSMSGRLGSGSFANARDTLEGQYAQQLGDIATGIYGGAYDQERQRQMAAAQQLGGLYNQDYMNRLQGTGQFADIYNMGLGSMFQGANAMSGDFRAGTGDMLRAAELSPQLAYQDYTDLGQLQAAGAGYQQQAQQEIDDARNRYDYYYGLGPGTDYQALQRYQSFINPFFSSTPVSQGPEGSTFGNVLSGAAGGAALGSTFGPWGTAIGGVGGGILGMF